MTATWAELSDEAHSLVAEAAAEGAVLRLVGSTGVRLHCRAAAEALDAMRRQPKDIDLVCRKEDRKALRRLFEARGYEIDRDLLVAMEGSRYSFSHPGTGHEVDVFVDRLEFCHTLAVRDRLSHHPATLPVEDLLLTKLQVHEPTETDVVDAGIVLATHRIADSRAGAEEIDAGHITHLLGADWGFHHTATANLRRLGELAAGGRFAALGAGAELVHARASQLIAALDAAPKTVRWRLRDRVGERVQWWQDVSDREATY